MAKKAKKQKKDSGSTIALNRSARHEFFVEEKYEAGIALEGWEVKALREGRVNIKDSYVHLKNGEAWPLDKRYNVRLADLQGKRRHRSLAFPRQICMYLARELTPLSLEEIGGYFGGRDHTTVLHACRKIDELCETDGRIREDRAKLVRVLTS